jgi:hypothetical protein
MAFLPLIVVKPVTHYSGDDADPTGFEQEPGKSSDV